VDKTGLTIIHPKKDLILEMNLKTDTGGSMDDIMNKMLAGQSGVEAYVFQGVPKICGFAPIPAANWALGATQNRAEFLGPVRAIRNGIFIVGGIALAVAIILVLFLSRSISNAIMATVEEISGAAEQVNSASGQLSMSSQQLAEGASEGAASLEETSASLEEMSSMTKQNADNASQADSLMRETRGLVNKAGTSMKEMTHSMEEISTFQARKSEKSSKPLTRSLSRPTSWPLTRPWKRPGPVKPEPVLPWWPMKCETWLSGPPKPPAPQRT
jgi:methyl-accepting chemotaxis protein